MPEVIGNTSARRDLHPDFCADYVLAGPQFNAADWFRKEDGVRWQSGISPKGNANFAWGQPFIHHLAPPSGSGEGNQRVCFASLAVEVRHSNFVHCA